MGQWIIDVMDAVGVEKAAIVGHSMGSLVALEVAAGNPDRVRSLAMVGVSIPIAVSEPLMSSAKAHSHEALDMMTYWSHSKVAQIGGSPTPGMWMVGGGLRLLEQTDPTTVHSDLRACDIYVTGIERARGIGCPTLLLLGAKDQMTPPRVAQTLREAIKDSDTVVFEDAGHALLTERPDPVLDQLIRIV
jgi:pimeloyl-ACP methyl ester carboxylesterase